MTMICSRHDTAYGEFCAGCLLDERDMLIDRLEIAGCPQTRAELRRLGIVTLRSLTDMWEYRKRLGKVR